MLFPKRQGVEIIYGRNAILEALRAGRPIWRILIAAGLPHKGSLARLIALAESRDVPVEEVERERLDKLAPGSQGVCAEVKPFSYASFDDMLAVSDEREEAPFLLLLDRIQDVENLGSLLRTAEAVGVHGVIIPERRAAPVTPAVHKASAGAVEHLLVARVRNIAQAIDALKEKGIWVIGLENVPEAKRYDEIDFTGPLALVVGSEGWGLRRLVRERCDLLTRLPMRGQIGSLNAAVAGSIVLYWAWQRREEKP